MNDPKIHERARKFARHANGQGNEAKVAKSRLDRLIMEHPDLVYLSIDNPMEPIVFEMDVPSAAHARVLDAIAQKTGCQHRLRAEPVQSGTVTLGRHEIVGCRADVQRACEVYALHGARIDYLVERIGRTYAAGLQVAFEVASDPVPETASSSAPENTDLSLLDPYFERALLHELAAEQIEEEGSPERERKVGEYAEGLVSSVVPNAFRPARLVLRQRDVAWNDPTLTLQECVASYFAMFPSGDLPEWKIEIRFRRGDRIYPPTRSWRKTGL
jgi:hypothetical protein